MTKNEPNSATDVLKNTWSFCCEKVASSSAVSVGMLISAATSLHLIIKCRFYEHHYAKFYHK